MEKIVAEERKGRLDRNNSLHLNCSAGAPPPDYIARSDDCTDICTQTVAILAAMKMLEVLSIQCLLQCQHLPKINGCQYMYYSQQQ